MFANSRKSIHHKQPHGSLLYTEKKKVLHGKVVHLKMLMGMMFCIVVVWFLFLVDPVPMEDVFPYENQTMVEFQTSHGMYTILYCTVEDLFLTFVLYILLSTGSFIMQLFPLSAPETVQNFMQLVDSGFYSDQQTGFYRSSPGFVLQGGGFIHDKVSTTSNVPVEYEYV